MAHQDTALSIGRTKEAALYFQSVIPMSVFAERVVGSRMSATLDELLGDLRNDLLPSALSHNKTFITEYASLIERIDLWVLRTALSTGVMPPPPDLLEITKAEYDNLTDTVHQTLARFLVDFGLRGVPVVMPSLAEPADQANGDIAVTLAGLKLVDVSRASWEQISEFRRDSEARKKLRHLRVFANDNYAGKNRSYVEDDLLRRLDDYEETARRWGFETRHGVLTTLLNSKPLLGAAGATFASVMFGAPLAAIAGLAGAGVLEVGRISLEISRRKFDLRNALRDNPVSYVAEAKQRLE